MSHVAAILAGVGLICTGLALTQMDRQINHLRADVACLQHPQAASSTSATIINGKVIMGKTTRTGCR